MGCFDTVAIPCPKCGHLEYAQSKGGDCRLANYTLQDVPGDVLDDINRHAPFDCLNCHTWFSWDPSLFPCHRVDKNRLIAEEIATLERRLAELRAATSEKETGNLTAQEQTVDQSLNDSPSPSPLEKKS